MRQSLDLGERCPLLLLNSKEGGQEDWLDLVTTSADKSKAKPEGKDFVELGLKKLNIMIVYCTYAVLF